MSEAISRQRKYQLKGSSKAFERIFTSFLLPIPPPLPPLFSLFHIRSILLLSFLPPKSISEEWAG